LIILNILQSDSFLQIEIVVAEMRKLLHFDYGVLENQILSDLYYGAQCTFSFYFQDDICGL